MQNIELGMDWIIYQINPKDINTVCSNINVKFVLLIIVHGKKEYLNASVLQAYVAIFLVFQVLYKWDSEGINSAK